MKTHWPNWLKFVYFIVLFRTRYKELDVILELYLSNATLKPYVMWEEIAHVTDITIMRLPLTYFLFLVFPSSFVVLNLILCTSVLCVQAHQRIPSCAYDCSVLMPVERQQECYSSLLHQLSLHIPTNQKLLSQRLMLSLKMKCTKLVWKWIKNIMHSPYFISDLSSDSFQCSFFFLCQWHIYR